ncbi:replicative DNA helicase [Propionivibrio sp.]|uniref:replicative DNA helicase n=1 Tax=Propionivibrio sp. TaxID=2212460 RepID=UPI0025CE4439|nr:replicative DNA helicase [Propionivibrio sp.]MBK7356874.1 replicative DNA helicase [Propionivibrio sp.]MBK8401695.1 replicative DNA helicase [Propionivibrio sp.]MBK8745033.1 replicative DNA helicase [Propionivibrio sp.]MBK8893895.1 replicative DNA helicase [Propionivibrio sp.]MBL0208198.1 replicative DNA helicase [Propionivibrio sp.]
MAKSSNSAFPQNASIDPAITHLRIPPHSIEAEQSVLGGLLLDNAAFDKIADLVGEGDFYRDEHKRIYRQIRKLLERNKPVDVVTVAESLDQAGEGDDTGGLAYLGELAANTPSASNIRRYAEIVRERAVLRQLVTAGDEIAGSALNPLGRDPKQLLDEAEARVFAIAEGGFRHQTGFQHINPLLTQVVERIQELHDRDNPSDITGVPTGYHDLDLKTSGLQAGDLLIIAGRPSMGKTSLALNMAEHVAIEVGLPVAVFSMEMGGTQLAMRMLSSVGRLDAQRVRTGRLNDDEWSRLSFALGKMHEAPLYIDETAALNPIDLRARARRLHRQCGKLGLIIIDYLQLMSVSGQGENRATEISEISRSLKSLAKELNVPVIALSQLNRSLEQRPNKRPVMSDLRESGAIEQDADVILFIYRDEVYNQDTPDKGSAEIIIGKQRNGPIGMVRLTFVGEYTRFENFASPGSY